MNFLIDGLKSWLIQRFSAVFLALFSIYLVVFWLFFSPQNYLQWQSWFSTALNQMLFTIAFILLMLHAWVGVRDVIFDYIKSTQLQNILLYALAVFLVVCAMWGWQIIYGS